MKSHRAGHAVTLFVLTTALSALLMPGAALASGAGLADDATIGVVGCSNTRQHVEGYEISSDLDKFVSSRSLDISGGTLRTWARDLSDNNRYWKDFTENVAESGGVDAIWIQLCIRTLEASSTGMTPEQQNDVRLVVGEARRRAAGAPVYISPLNEFVSNDCTATGAYGVPNAIQLADWATASGLALRGPNTGPLDHSQLQADLCHLASTGLPVVGEQMSEFFDYSGQPPLADFTFSPLRPRAGDVVVFQDVSTDDGAIVSWSWSFGNGLARNTQSARATYSEAGTYVVTLSITDDDGETATVSKSVVVGRAAIQR